LGQVFNYLRERRAGLMDYMDYDWVENEDLELCPVCILFYPNCLLSQMCIDGGYTPPICGPCARIIMGAKFGLPGIQFRGEMASEMEDDAYMWLGSQAGQKANEDNFKDGRQS
jgi:hypothetical protein